MAWDVELAQEFVEWFEALTEAEQESIAHSIDMLEAFGPTLSRPYVDTLKGSRFPNMKELRAQHEGRPYRMLFAFDPRRIALMLIGGDKTGDNNWYEKMLPLAERIFEKHLASLKKGS